MTMPLLMLVVLIITFGVKFHGTSGSCSSFPMSLHDGRTLRATGAQPCRNT